MACFIKYPENIIMESQQITETKKHTLGQVHAQELAWKFKSKEDFYTHLNKHRKYDNTLFMTPL